MKYQIKIHKKPDYHEIKTEGNAEVKVFNKFLNEIFTNPQWSPGQSLLLDHSDLEMGLLRTDEVRTISKIVLDNKDKIGRGKWAFIVSGNFAYGMARMWQIITEEKAPMEINIFKDRQEAISWLLNGKLKK